MRFLKDIDGFSIYGPCPFCFFKKQGVTLHFHDSTESIALRGARIFAHIIFWICRRQARRSIVVMRFAKRDIELLKTVAQCRFLHGPSPTCPLFVCEVADRPYSGDAYVSIWTFKVSWLIISCSANSIWVSDAAKGTLKLGVSHCAVCSFSKVGHPFLKLHTPTRYILRQASSACECDQHCKTRSFKFQPVINPIENP